jgi:hypothetical protein
VNNPSSRSRTHIAVVPRGFAALATRAVSAGITTDNADLNDIATTSFARQAPPRSPSHVRDQLQALVNGLSERPTPSRGTPGGTTSTSTHWYINPRATHSSDAAAQHQDPLNCISGFENRH